MGGRPVRGRQAMDENIPVPQAPGLVGREPTSPNRPPNKTHPKALPGPRGPSRGPLY